jgi:hypothetical protein
MNAKRILIAVTALASLAISLAQVAQAELTPGSPFTGRWTATGLDGSNLTMHVGQGDAPRVQFRDSYTDCAGDGTSSRWTGLGTGEYFEVWLFVNFDAVRCGTSASDDRVELQFFWDPANDTLWEDEDGDGVGITWFREVMTWFSGHWTATDLDGSTLTMHIGRGATPHVQLRDSYTDCSGDGTPSAWTGLGSGEYFEIWLFVNFELVHCGASSSGDAPVLQFFRDYGGDTLWEDEDGDGVGITWYRDTAALP